MTKGRAEGRKRGDGRGAGDRPGEPKGREKRESEKGNKAEEKESEKQLRGSSCVRACLRAVRVEGTRGATPGTQRCDEANREGTAGQESQWVSGAQAQSRGEHIETVACARASCARPASLCFCAPGRSSSTATVRACPRARTGVSTRARARMHARMRGGTQTTQALDASPSAEQSIERSPFINTKTARK
eukprot:2044611-Pleurochrysis_carterae.AAC.1